MNFNELDKTMRLYETSHDVVPVPGMYLIARLDGRSFTGITKNLQKPFSQPFRDLMVETMKALMGPQSGFKILYGYTESDEISLLLDPSHNAFNNKERKLNSLLAGFASAYFTRISSGIVQELPTFDCRISQLPNVELVVDYFRWRQEDSARNCLNGYAYHTLRQSGMSSRQATRELSGQGRAFKHDLLMEYGLNFVNCPAWQKNGIGMWKETYQKTGHNPTTGKDVLATRTRLHVDYDLPYGEPYADFIRNIL